MVRARECNEAASLQIQGSDSAGADGQHAEPILLRRCRIAEWVVTNIPYYKRQVVKAWSKNMETSLADGYGSYELTKDMSGVLPKFVETIAR